MVFARSTPIVQSVMVHFAQLPPIQLPCGDLKLYYYPEYVKKHENIINYNSTGETIKSLRVQHEILLENAGKMKIELAKSLENFLMAGYANFRAMQSQNYLLQKETEVKFLYQQVIWYSQLAQATYIDYQIRESAQKYYKLTAPIFSALNYSERTDLIQKFSTRLACLHEHRQDAFEKITQAKRYSLEELMGFTKNKTITIEQASKRASDIAKFSSFSREYGWMAAEVASLTAVLQKLLNAHETAILSKELHPRLMKAQKKYGAALGPSDKFPKDSETDQIRRIRLEIVKVRAQIALNHMYLQQTKAEQIYTSQLNFSSGITAGLSKVSNIAMKTGKDFIRTKHLLPYDEFMKAGSDVLKTGDVISFNDFLTEYKRDPGMVELALIMTAAEFANSTFSLVTSSIVDTVTGWMQVFADVKTSIEKAKDTYIVDKQKTDFAIKAIKKIIATLDPDNPGSFREGMHLSGFIVMGKKFDSTVAKQIPNEVGRLLEDAGFIAATGGGLGWVLEPLCESPTQRNSLLITAARKALTGNARSAFHRIAFDRGLWIDNPDLPLTKDILKGNSLSDYADNDFEKVMLSGNTNLIYGIPLIGDAKFAYDKVPFIRNLLKFEGKNEGSQDEFLLKLIDQQELFDQVLAALKRVRYNFSKLSIQDPHSFNKHLLLLSQCPEYLAAYIKIRNAYWERSKIFNYTRFLKPDSDQLESEGKAVTASIEKAHELEVTDLTAKLSYLTMEYQALSINYIATAQELKVLQQAENMRRAAHGEKGKVDLSLSITAFEKQARLSELTVATKNLATQLAVSYITAGLVNKASNSIISRLPARWGLKTIPFEKAIHSELLGALNPWVGKFSTQGIWDVFKDATADAAVESATQVTAKYFKIDKDWESSLNQLFKYSMDIGRNIGSATIEAHYARQEVLARVKQLEQFEAPVQARVQKDNEINADLLHAIKNKQYIKAKRLKNEMFKRAQQAALDNNSLIYKKTKAGLDEALELEHRLQISHKNDVQTMEGGELTKALFRRRLARTQQDNDKNIEIAGKIITFVDFKQEMNTGTPSVESLKKLVDTIDDTGLHKHLLKDGFDIYLIRKGLQAAKDRASLRLKLSKGSEKKYEAELEQIDQIATKIDDKRIELVNNTLEEFFILNPGIRESVVSVMQGGAAKNNPEYQGIFGDIDFTVLTKPGANGVTIKKALETFFKDKNYPIATKQSDGYSPMDTEAFIQSAGSFDSSKESVTDIVKDVSVKMDDPTRFYTEAGGKWFINNMAYSGKRLWPPGGEDSKKREFVKIPRVEAHGLALDMTRYMEFLTNPKYDAQNIKAMSEAKAAMSERVEQKKVLGSVLKKTKYFIRLIDAYVISHEQGNTLYHKRVENRKEEGDDASYHWQIYKDVENLVNNGHKTVFDKPGDIQIIKDMAKMKMKGKNPSPFDVLGDDVEGINQGIKMVARMEELAASILASTAQVHLDETLEIVKSGSEAQKKRGVSDQFRMASTLRKIFESDNFGTESLATSKVKAVVQEDGTTKYFVLSEKKHHDEYAANNQSVKKYRKINELYKKIDSLIIEQPLKDPRGLTTRLEIAKIVRELFGTRELVPKPTEAAFQNLALKNSSGIKFNFAIASRLLKSLKNNSSKGVE